MSQSPVCNGEIYLTGPQLSLRVGDIDEPKELYLLTVLFFENTALKGSEI